MLARLGKDILIYGIASGISKFIGIFLLPVYTAYFTKEQYGSLDLITTVISFVAIVGMLQLESAISRYYYEVKGVKRQQYISTAFWFIFVLSLLMVIIVFSISDYISKILFDNNNYSNVLRIASINILLFNLFGFLTVLIRFRKKPILYGIIVFVQFFITAIVSVILIVYYSYSIKAFFIGQVAGLLIASIIIFTYLRKDIIFYFNRKILKNFLSFSLPMVPAVAGNWLNSYVNRFVMLGYLTIADIGVYAVALKVASIFKLLDNAFRMAWGPYIWEQVKNKDYKALLRKLSIIITIIILLFSLVFALFAKEAILILSNKKYFDAIPLVQILVFAFAFPILTQVIGIGAAIAKKTIYNTISFFIGVSVNIGLLFILVPKIGVVGVPVSLLFSNISILFFMWYFSERLSKININIVKIVLIIIAFLILLLLELFFKVSLINKIILTIMLLSILFYIFKKLKKQNIF